MKKLLFCALLMLLGMPVFSQKAPKGVEINIYNNDDFSGLQMLEVPAKQAKIIMTGENHTYVGVNSHIELKMLRFLNQKTGLRNFIIELGEARAHYLNRYINNADTLAEKYLKACTSPKYMDLFKRMRKYNLSLPDSLRIRIWGIDVERFFDLPLIRLSELLPKNNIPNNLLPFAETVRGSAKYLETTGLEDYEKARDRTKGYSYSSYGSPKFYMNPTVDDLIRYFDSLDGDFRTWLGAEYANVATAMSWLKQYKQWRDYENTTFQYIWREENIYRNIVKLLDANPNEKFYGQFGRCHTAYEEQNADCSWYGYHSVVNKLRSRYYKNPEKVLTVGIFYKGFGDISYYSDNEDREALKKEISALADETKLHSVELFDLEDEQAELPQLIKKFSYAIMDNHFVVEGDNDSVESEIISPEKGVVNNFQSYSEISIGLLWNNVSYSMLNSYVAQYGHTSSFVSKPWGVFDIAQTEGRFSTTMRYAWLKYQTIFNNDSGKLGYGVSQFFVKIQYHPLVKKRLQIGIGINAGIGNEKINWTPRNSNILKQDNAQKFVNTTFLLGPTASVKFKFLSRIFLAAEASQCYDLSRSQWRLANSRLEYGNVGKVTKGLTGFYFGGTLGFEVD